MDVDVGDQDIIIKLAGSTGSLPGQGIHGGRGVKVAGGHEVGPAGEEGVGQLGQPLVVARGGEDVDLCAIRLRGKGGRVVGEKLDLVVEEVELCICSLCVADGRGNIRLSGADDVFG